MEQRKTLGLKMVSLEQERIPEFGEEKRGITVGVPMYMEECTLPNETLEEADRETCKTKKCSKGSNCFINVCFVVSEELSSFGKKHDSELSFPSESPAYLGLSKR